MYHFVVLFQRRGAENVRLNHEYQVITCITQWPVKIQSFFDETVNKNDCVFVFLTGYIPYLFQEVLKHLMKRYVAAMIRDAKTEEGLTEENFKVDHILPNSRSIAKVYFVISAVQSLVVYN